jgi:hypothetical protein
MRAQMNRKLFEFLFRVWIDPACGNMESPLQDCTDRLGMSETSTKMRKFEACKECGLSLGYVKGTINLRE